MVSKVEAIDYRPSTHEYVATSAGRQIATITAESDLQAGIYWICRTMALPVPGILTDEETAQAISRATAAAEEQDRTNDGQ